MTTYNEAEDSVDSSEPVELYEFTVFGVLRRFTSADRDITYQGHVWIHHESLARNDIEDTGRTDQAFINVTAREDFEISALYDPYPTDVPVGLRIIRLQLGADTDQARTTWVGLVASVSWPSIGFSQLRCEHFLSAFNRPGLRRKVQKNCQHLLYGPDCKADPAPHTTTITVSSVVGRTIYSPDLAALPAGWGNGGTLLWEFPVGRPFFRGTWNHVGDHFDVTYPVPGLVPGSVVTIRRGCNHSYTITGTGSGATEGGDCKTVFNNTPNYGGFQLFQGKNIFDPAEPLL